MALPPPKEQQAALPSHPLLRQCLSIDLEVSTTDGRIHALAAYYAGTGEPLSRNGDQACSRETLLALDRMAQRAEMVLGHNIIDFDLPHLRAVDPGLKVLDKAVVDTLRLNPLAFPRNPYHSLVKHYRDGDLIRNTRNDPLLDAQLALEVFSNQLEKFAEADPRLLTAWHWLTGRSRPHNGRNGFDLVFSHLRRAPMPSFLEAREDMAAFLEGKGCRSAVENILENLDGHGWPLAYALAWVSVAGGDSSMPPWVIYQWPDAPRLVRVLRDTPCHGEDCRWCGEHQDARKELERWTGYASFRPKPEDQEGRPLQQTTVEMAMQRDHLLAIMPTGSGKSACYQVPALSRYHKTGALTVVISPLVALMEDQVAGLEARGINTAVTINGLLSMPERTEALNRLRLGEAAILIISPEQLRSRAVRTALLQRDIGGWVLDEAHCLSKWGHDFRPDYRYIGRFIRENFPSQEVPPVMCLTATAKPEVREEILEYFSDSLDIQLEVLDGGSSRTNLEFEVIPTTESRKLDHLQQLMEHGMPLEQDGGVIVYCATQRHTEQVAQYLATKGVNADHFHGGLSSERKKDVQQSFISGGLRAIAATNAFGMGIDKPDVRMVIHADIPGTLENYLQEAGRAGRDNRNARCILLYTEQDMEQQFNLSASSRLNQQEISAVLRALRTLDRKTKSTGEVIATTGEILLQEEEREFHRDSHTDDTRMRTAVSWLEEADLLRRYDNLTNIFPSSIRVPNLDEARRILASRQGLTREYRSQLLHIIARIMNASADEGITTDELMAATGLDQNKVRAALEDLHKLQLVANDIVITAFVHQGVANQSRARYDAAADREVDLIRHLQEQGHDQEIGEHRPLHLRNLTQHLRDQGHRDALPLLVQRALNSIASDGRADTRGTGNLRVRSDRTDTLHVTLLQDWKKVEEDAQRRRSAARAVLGHLLGKLPRQARGADLLAETTMGELTETLQGRMDFSQGTENVNDTLQQALLWLHDQQIIRLNKGLTVLRPAMTIRLEQGNAQFTASHFEPLQEHYKEQVAQIHIMGEYAEQGKRSMSAAVQLALDYFQLTRDAFIDRWLPHKKNELARQTTPASWRAIVDGLNNTAQRQIVTDDRTTTNVLVLAGPGSGKTRALVHRIAYLIRCQRERPSSIIALAYNRHAAVQIRQRLHQLIGEESRGVVVMTCHALAMRITGRTFAGSQQGMPAGSRAQTDFFNDILIEATRILEGQGAGSTGADGTDANEQRDHIMAGFRWILVDEYQDIKEQEYNLISALAGRTRNEPHQKLSILAVGDDDQNIYSFSGSSTEYIHRFEAEYRAQTTYLVENYRSTDNIIEAASSVIERAADRMKTDHPVAINRARRRERPGGVWEGLDPVAQGRVQVLPMGDDPAVQAVSAVTELERLKNLDKDWDWSRCAIIARNWYLLDAVRALCELKDIPVQLSREDFSATWQLRETQLLLRWLEERENRLATAQGIQEWLEEQPANRWNRLLLDAIEVLGLETEGAEIPVPEAKEWLAEWARENRRRQHGLLLTSAHRAKGLEFEHVVVLDGEWDRKNGNEDLDAPRRLYYVAMTRAQKTLTLAELDSSTNPFLRELYNNPRILKRQKPDGLVVVHDQLRVRYHRLSLRDVDLSYAGRRAEADRIHRAISALQPGDPLTVRTSTIPWELVDGQGNLVGRLARSYDTVRLVPDVRARVLAVARWDRGKSQAPYNRSLKSMEWEVVIPELIAKEEGA